MGGKLIRRETYILIDVSYLANRAMHTVGDLCHPEKPEQRTGIHYQIWKTAEQVARRFLSNNLVFCFDSRTSKRKELCPTYKASRETKKATEKPALQAARAGMYQQVNSLPRLLRSMGVVNVYGQVGREADDIIASIVKTCPEHEYYIVARDGDLNQLLTDHVTLFDPNSKLTYNIGDFFQEWNISPEMWPSVKAWAGCTSDDVKGLPGVGEKTAVKYLTGTLNAKLSKYALFAENQAVYNTNIPLVTLPIEGTDKIRVTPQVDPIRWHILAEHIGSYNYQPTGEICDD
jgi:DNA polymerase-1